MHFKCLNFLHYTNIYANFISFAPSPRISVKIYSVTDFTIAKTFKNTNKQKKLAA